MPGRAIFVAATIDARLGGIARSVPALAMAFGARNGEPAGGTSAVSSESGGTFLIAPRPSAHSLEGLNAHQIDLRLCNGFAGVKAELHNLTAEGGRRPRFIYHAGVWNSLNHFVAKLGRRKGIPVIVSIRSMLDPWALNHRKWKKRLAWWLYARRDLLSATAIHATAGLEAGYIRKALGEKCPPVIVVPNGVFLKRGTRDEGRESESVPTPTSSLIPGTKKLLFLSRIHEKKGLPDLIRAFGELNPEGWELVIAGNDDGWHQAGCERLARGQPNADRIRFHGPVADADKWDLYRSADLFVLPSYSENFGIVVGEALGSGLPVITTTETPWGEYLDGGQGTREAISGRKGLWVIETGVEALKQKLSEVIELDESERRERAARGAEWIRREFTWEAIGRKFLEEVEKVLG